MLGDGAAAGILLSRTLPPGSGPGLRERTYQVFVPDGLGSEDAVPVVMILHGCLQSEQNMIRATRFTELAEREGFIVAFPSITSSAAELARPDSRPQRSTAVHPANCSAPC
ncbi:MAG: PHB depolymerase family esterase [Geminicoccaceae bacterium]